ncbi:MAG: class II aldolase/adducin family protein [Spirochaetes bacterium]|nr:MAG: class II aldolase/adducin family protein [Spirochaetota bacterium]
MDRERVWSLRKELAQISRRAFERDLVGGTGGNISARIPDTDRVLITPSGVSLGDVTPESIIMVDLEGSVIESTLDYIPSKETGFHLSVYRLRTDVLAIAHLHPPHATAYSACVESLPLVTVSSRVVLKNVPRVECALPGSEALKGYVTEGIKKDPEVKALLMREHGILALGPDLKTAFYIADLVEDTAKIAYLISNIKNIE